MYTRQDERSVEKICHEQEHIDKVLKIIKDIFPKYFDKFITSEAGHKATEHDIQKISNSLGIETKIVKKNGDKTENCKNILIQGLNDFNKDRKKYTDIFDKEALEEYKDDPAAFKSQTLRNECPIIHFTLQNKRAKALDKYRRDFNMSNANELLSVVTNLYNFANNYISNVYNPNSYDNIMKYEDLFFSELDKESCTVYGVIGGGIKSHMLYKNYPSAFPNRSRAAIWALWYLTDKKLIDCEKDSEFLMIDIKENTTQQNYFYPYELFSFYAHQIYLLLKFEMGKLDVRIDPEFRYVAVDSFLDFVANDHSSEIELLISKIKESNDE
jgi:hypothetical protein